MIGRSIGNYVVRSRIGQGGQGTVYLADHPRLSRRVAIKVIRAESRHPHAVARFFAEARSASEIRNDHIVDVLDCGELDDGTSYYVMEWLDGRSLAAALAAEGRLSPGRAVHLAFGAGQALAAAHAAGIVHRDLKPDNLFLVRRPEDPEFVKVLDFGIAKFVDGSFDVTHRTESGAILGTPAYMSPEQCRGGKRRVDARADVYSLGVILYEALTGRLPFESEGLGDLLLEKMTRRPQPLRAVEPTVPAGLDEVVLRALASRPEDRFPSMASFMEALEPCAASGERWILPPPQQPASSVPDDGSGATGAAPGRRSANTTLGAAATETYDKVGRRTTSRRSVAAALVGGAAMASLIALLAWRRLDAVPATSPIAPSAGAPVAPPAAAPAPPAPEAAPPPTARLTVRTDPADAQVILDGIPIANPFSGSFHRADVRHRLEVRAHGHQTDARWIVLDVDQDLVVRLVRGSSRGSARGLGDGERPAGPIAPTEAGARGDTRRGPAPPAGAPPRPPAGRGAIISEYPDSE